MAGAESSRAAAIRPRNPRAPVLSNDVAPVGSRCSSLPRTTSAFSTDGDRPAGSMPRRTSSRRNAPARYKACPPWFSVNPCCCNERARPPMGWASSTVTRSPLAAACAAATSPATPAPTTTMSVRSVITHLRPFDVAAASVVTDHGRSLVSHQPPAARRQRPRSTSTSSSTGRNVSPAIARWA